MTIYKENLEKVMDVLLANIYVYYAKKTGAKKEDQTREGKILQKICDGINGLRDAALYAEKPCEPVPIENEMSSVQDGWIPATFTEIEGYNRNGSEYINSCSEALIKSHGIINFLSKVPNQRRRIFYRGEHIYGRSLKPRIGRKICKHDPAAPLQVTSCELDLLKKFQDKVKQDTDFADSIFEGKIILPDDHPGWWALMAHYEEEFGTRMIDLTSSIFSALYFACVSWDGKIDESTDGALYLIQDDGKWRHESSNSDEILDLKKNSAEEYFRVDGHKDILRFRESPVREQRIIAQDGYFIWQPKFDEPINLVGSWFKFRVYRGAKQDILRELYSIGYTAQRIVRGKRGDEIHQILCEKLDLDQK